MSKGWPQVRRVAALGVLLAIELLYGWTWNSVDILRPQLRAEFGLSLTQVGALYSAQAAGALCGALVIGQVADRAGRRNTLAATVGVLALLLAAGTMHGGYAGLLVQRVLLGLAMGGAAPTIASLYIGLFEPHVRAKLASLFNAVFTGSVIALTAALASLPSAAEWRLLFWAGAAFGMACVPLVFLIPDDHPHRAPGGNASIPMVALFAPDLRRYTILLVAMAGLNYFAAQAFTGWTTSFLTETRGLATAEVARAVAWQATGSLVGGFAWGWFGDRFGRRSAYVGYLLGALLMIVYLTVPRSGAAFVPLSFAVGAAIAASVVWPPWMAEVFPEHLRATALSVFNWGRVVSFVAPLVTGTIAQTQGLAVAMALGPIALLIVAFLWRKFPETLKLEGSAP